jgi:hypothetical protein
MIGGHDRELPQLRRPDQSRDDGEINAEVGGRRDFLREGGADAGLFRCGGFDF